MTDLRSALERYLSMRKGLGYKYQHQTRRLANFVSFMEKRKATTITTKLAMEWATLPPDRYATWASQRVLAIPSKRHDKRQVHFLTRPEIEAILAASDRTTWLGRRDHTLLLLAAQTGLRLSELISLDRDAVHLGAGAHVRCVGKGRKERFCPLWPQTAKTLRSFCKERNLDLRSDAKVFLNHRGEGLTRFGVRYILAKYLTRARSRVASLAKKRLHPHSMRHSAAVAMLKSGVDLSSISQWLGHASLNTTNRYATIDLEMKRKAIAQVKTIPRSSCTPWKKDRTILKWLESL